VREVGFVHEMSLCEAIASSVAKLADGGTVTSVSIRVGHFRQVVPNALSFCWEMLTEGSNLGGSKLVIEQVPAVIECEKCGVETTLEMPILLCEACGSDKVTMVSGEEFRIDSFDIEED
jgi:hydrogenase nickel incorporation protein HypA/HybF